MLDQPTLSVIMANYNHARFLPEALEAIVTQSYRPKEIIIMDDGSTDNSVEIIEKFAYQESNIHFLRNERNMGGMYCVERLMELASGDYLYSAAADDRVLPGFFLKSMRLLSQYPEAGLCSSLSQLMDENGNNKGLWKTPIPSTVECYLTPKKCSNILNKQGVWLLGNATIFHRQALIEAGGFRQDLGAFCDWFAMQVIALRHGACFIPEQLAVYRKIPESYSRTTMNSFQPSIELYRKIIMLMHTTFHNLFTPEYIKKLENSALFASGLRSWVYDSNQTERSLFVISNTIFPNPSYRDKFYLILFRLSQYVTKIIVMIYLSRVLTRVSSWYRFTTLWRILKNEMCNLLRIT